MAEDHIVRQGECLLSIAHSHGLYWETVWEDAQNGELRNLREDPNVLMPGDVLHVPDRCLIQENAATEQRHRFRRRGVPAKLHLHLIRQAAVDESEQGATLERSIYADPPATEESENEPEADTPFVLIVEEQTLLEGMTDADGYLEASIPPSANQARLILHPGTELEREITLRLGSMDPIDESPGIRKRLSNLGYHCPVVEEADTSQLEDIIRMFQRRHSLEATGRMDAQTRSQLLDLHGS